MNSISVLFALLFVVTRPAVYGLGNAMQPEYHATALVPMITGTNVPESEEEIDAPIYDQNEVDRVVGQVKDIAKNGPNAETMPVLGDFLKANPGLLSTAASLTGTTTTASTTTTVNTTAAATTTTVANTTTMAATTMAVPTRMAVNTTNTTTPK